MAMIDEIIKSDKKPKEKVSLLAESIKNDTKLIAQLIGHFETCPKSEKGTYIEALEIITQDSPEIVTPYIEFVIENIDNKLPRVKWETARIIGNMARKFPELVTEALPKLLINTEDESTVVRWSAAFALTEIIKNNSKLHDEYIAEFQKILEKEKNNGVKNIYIKALKSINK